MLAITSRLGTDILETFTSMFNPLPSIALLPLALIWFGLGKGALTFVIIHSVLWAVALNTHSGFLSVSNTLRMVASGQGGLGWFIYENKNLLEIANVFAGLFSVILIGLLVENVVFRIIEQRTVRRWGMQSQ
jgi:NitT/TauT family transport system permease protein